MKQMAKFMVVHNDPNIEWEKVEENWRKLAQLEEVKWDRTFFNRAVGARYCLWFAPDKEKLERVFKDLSISFESVVEVEETVPDMWGKKWEEHLEKEKHADTLGF